MKKQREYWIDQCRAIAFLLVILGHTENFLYLHTWIDSFHMPLFFLITGLTFSWNKYRNTAWQIFVMEKIQKLVIPYFWLCFVCFPTWVLNWKILPYNYYSGALWRVIVGIFLCNDGYASGTANTLWFIGALFLAHLLMYAAVNISKESKACFFSILSIYAVIGFSTGTYIVPWHLNTAFAGAFYIGCGWCIKQYFIPFWNESITSGYGKIGMILLISTAGCLAWYQNGFKVTTVMKDGTYGNVMWFLMSSLCLSLVVMLVMMRCPQNKILDYIGQNTFLYLALHIQMIRTYFNGHLPGYDDPFVQFVLAFVIFFLLVPVCMFINHFMPYLGGKSYVRKGRLSILMEFAVITWCGVVPVYAVFVSKLHMSIGAGLLIGGVLVAVVWLIMNHWKEFFFQYVGSNEGRASEAYLHKN